MLKNIKIVMEKSWNHRGFKTFCLLSPNMDSTVYSYADESMFDKFTFLFRSLPTCR